jgi:hypothetical protein
MTGEQTPRLGDCFYLAGLRFLNWCMERPKDRSRLRLVHGRPTMTIAPFIKMGHAWIEIDEEVVVDPSGMELPIAVYYSVGQIDPAECLRYTHEEYSEKLNEHEHWGPWDLPEDPEETQLRERLERKEAACSRKKTKRPQNRPSIST